MALFASFRGARSLLLLPLVLCAAHRTQAQGAPLPALSPVVRVTLQVDSASTATFDARGFDLNVSPTGTQPVVAEIQLVKQAGAHTGSLLSLSANRLHALGAVIEILDSFGAPAVTFRLSDVSVPG